MIDGQSQTLNRNHSLLPPTWRPSYFSSRSNNPGHRRFRRFHKNKKFDNRFAPFAPRNTTSFIIRAKRCGGIAPRVSPCPVTPSMLETPEFSPAREVLVDMAKEEWGVEEEGEGEIGGGPSDSDVEEHIETERRLDHDVSRFEMIYPSGDEQRSSRFHDQNTHIAQLEEENCTLRERLFVMEKELQGLRRRVSLLGE